MEKYANEIVARNMDRSIMEIDDRWQRKYGDFDFDSDKFPDPKVGLMLKWALGFSSDVSRCQQRRHGFNRHDLGRPFREDIGLWHRESRFVHAWPTPSLSK